MNSTTDMKPFRAALVSGYQDAGEQSGAGGRATWPSDFPLLTIDHILTRNATTTSLRTVGIPGSDHRGLLAVVRIPS
jgi:endonuclease/exonuclease/phosphatase family metal-dependent hydrolase